MTITAPRCRTCGVTEYCHTCRGALKAARKLAKAAAPVKSKKKFGQRKRAQ